LVVLFEQRARLLIGEVPRHLCKTKHSLEQFFHPNRVGLASASALVVTVEDPAVAERIVAAARARRPDLHIIVRACDEAARERLAVHGARTVSAESFAPGPQLASCALDALGAPAQTIKALIEDAGLEERSAPLANPEENHVKS